MTEQDAIEYLENHGYISDDVRDMAIKALEKQMPKKIIGTEEFPVYAGDTVSGICPECMTDYVCITSRMYKEKGLGYCKECGQKLDWGEEE